jgi:hypothetical protein
LGTTVKFSLTEIPSGAVITDAYLIFSVLFAGDEEHFLSIFAYGGDG